MKICWDNLEKYSIKLSGNGNFLFWSGSQWKTIYYHSFCESCGEPYLSGKNQRFCCKSCSNKKNALNNPDKIYENLQIKGRKTKEIKYGNPNFNNPEKAKITSIKRYGVDHPSQLKEVQQKVGDTKERKYGNRKFVNIEKAQQTNLEKRGVKTTFQDPKVKEKSVQTLRQNYNDDTVVNPFEIKEIQQKIEKTNEEKYDVKNVLQKKEFRNDKQRAQSNSLNWKNKTGEEIEEIKQKKRETWKNKTGEEIEEIKQKKKDTWENKTDEEKIKIYNKMIETQKKNGTFGVSKISQIFFWKLYKHLTYSQKNNCYFYELNDEYKILNYSVDFIINNKIIEFFGDKWHANPKTYNYNDMPKPKDNYNLTAEEIWNKDNKRLNNIINEGYETLIIWASEVINNEYNIIKKCLNFINN